jgi:hypothetical protein
MSESQSRYSIVERLTKEKLEIISAKSNLDSDITVKKQAVDEAKADLSDWEKNIKSDVEELRQKKKREIEKLERAAKNAAEKKKIKANTYEEKIKAINEALVQIQQISETAGKE